MLKYLPAMRETQVQSLSWEASPGEGNVYPLQCSCLKNSMERGAWQATVHECEESDMALKFIRTPFCFLFLVIRTLKTTFLITPFTVLN